MLRRTVNVFVVHYLFFMGKSKLDVGLRKIASSLELYGKDKVNCKACTVFIHKLALVFCSFSSKTSHRFQECISSILNQALETKKNLQNFSLFTFAPAGPLSP